MLVALSVLASMVYGMDTVLFVGASEERLGLGPDGFGVLMTGLARRRPARRRLRQPARALAAARRCAHRWRCSSTACPNIVLAVTESTALAVAAQVVRGAGTLVVDVLAMTALQRAVAPDVTARVFGVFWALIVGAIALGALVAPPVVAVLGLEGGDRRAGRRARRCCRSRRIRRSRRWTAPPPSAPAVLAARVAVLEATGLFAAAPRPVLERLAAETSEIDGRPAARS